MPSSVLVCSDPLSLDIVVSEDNLYILRWCHHTKENPFRNKARTKDMEEKDKKGKTSVRVCFKHYFISFEGSSNGLGCCTYIYKDECW